MQRDKESVWLKNSKAKNEEDIVGAINVLMSLIIILILILMILTLI